MVHFLAFSLQDQVEKYGAYIGIAAFFGLAVLTILYFSQARELRRLRDWAGRAPERAQELEQRVVAQAEAARQAPAPIAARHLAEMPVVPPPPPTGAHAAAAAAPQATVEADVLEGEEAASTNGHHDAPVPPPPGLASATPGADAPEEESDADGAAEGAVNGSAASTEE